MKREGCGFDGFPFGEVGAGAGRIRKARTHSQPAQNLRNEKREGCDLMALLLGK